LGGRAPIENEIVEKMPNVAGGQQNATNDPKDIPLIGAYGWLASPASFSRARTKEAS